MGEQIVKHFKLKLQNKLETKQDLRNWHMMALN